MKVRICVAQINYSSDIQRHVQRLKKIIKENSSADLIVFPELILHGHPSLERPEGFLYRKVKQYYRKIKDESDDLYAYVKECGARIIIGELRGKPTGFYNAATYIDKQQTESYLKTHVHWTENFIPGNKIRVFNSAIGKIGINICFDGAFPEMWRVAALKGAWIIVNISAVPRTFPVDYMWLRLKSAAMNNQVFVVYANRPGDFFSGHSAVFGPRGETVTSGKTKECILKAEIDREEVIQWRKEERIYQNRLPVLYRDIGRSTVRQMKKRTAGK